MEYQYQVDKVNTFETVPENVNVLLLPNIFIGSTLDSIQVTQSARCSYFNFSFGKAAGPDNTTNKILRYKAIYPLV